jgi:hypothetical protein
MQAIEDAYTQIAELPVEFDRKDIERILFERTLIQLEKEGREKTEDNIRGQYYSFLSSIVMELERYKFRPGEKCIMKPNPRTLGVYVVPLISWTPEQ